MDSCSGIKIEEVASTSEVWIHDYCSPEQNDSNENIPMPENPLPDTLMPEGDYKWTNNGTKILLELYLKYKDDVGTAHIRSMKQLFDKIAQEVKASNIFVTGKHVHNRLRVLERQYKKYVNNQNKTGRGRKFLDYYEEMEKIFSKKITMEPEIVLEVDTNTIDVSIEERDNLSVSCNKKTAVRKTSSTLEKCRIDRKEYYKKKLEIEKEKLIELRRRNDLLEKRNEILSKRCKCRIDY